MRRSLKGQEILFWNIIAGQSDEGHIQLTWETHVTGVIDIEYYHETEQPWGHSVAKYIGPVPSQNKEFTTGVNPGRTGIWRFRIKYGDWRSDAVSAELKGATKPAKGEIYLPGTLVGYWDHVAAPNKGAEFDHVNVGKGLSAWDIQDIIDQGLKGIPMIAGFNASDSVSTWRRRLNGTRNTFRRYGAENMPLVLIMDEPYSRGWRLQQLEKITEEARSAIGNGFKFGFTFTEGNIRGWSNHAEIPRNIDYLLINYYPFRHESGVSGESHFKSRMRASIDNAIAKKASHTKIGIVGQAFAGGRWHEPPAESPLWYAQIVAEYPEIDLLLWFEWRSRVGTGTRDMPDLLDAQRKIIVDR